MVMNAQFAAQESELTKLKHEIELKDQEIQMVKLYHQQLNSKSIMQNDYQPVSNGKIGVNF